MINLIETYPVAASASFGLGGTLIGVVLGNWLALGRDKRKERIEVAQRMRDVLLRERSWGTPSNMSITDRDIDLYIRMLDPWERPSFRKAVAEYKNAKNDVGQDELGEIYSRNPDAVFAAIEKLIPYTAKR